MAGGLAPRAKSKSLSANLAGAIAAAVVAVDVAVCCCCRWFELPLSCVMRDVKWLWQILGRCEKESKTDNNKNDKTNKKWRPIVLSLALSSVRLHGRRHIKLIDFRKHRNKSPMIIKVLEIVSSFSSSSPCRGLCCAVCGKEKPLIFIGTLPMSVNLCHLARLHMHRRVGCSEAKVAFGIPWGRIVALKESRLITMDMHNAHIDRHVWPWGTRPGPRCRYGCRLVARSFWRVFRWYQQVDILFSFIECTLKTSNQIKSYYL